MPPLVPWVVGLIAGIVVDSMCPIDTWSVSAVLVCAAVYLMWRKGGVRGIVAAALVCGLCCGSLLHHRSFWEVSENDIVNYVGEERVLARLRGEVVSDPRMYSVGYEPFNAWLFDVERTSFVLEADGIGVDGGWGEVCGCVRVTVKDSVVGLVAGDGVELSGWVSRIRGPANPGQFDWRLFNARQGIRVQASCEHAENVIVSARVQSDAGDTLRSWRRYVRKVVSGDVMEVDSRAASLMDAMILGLRGEVDQELEELFVKSGCGHYLAVSGIHVAILAFAVLGPLRLLGVSRRWCAIITMVVVAGYVLLAEPRPSVLRAGIMTWVFCLVLLLRRQRSVAGAICAAALIVLTLDPVSLFDIGFQLSFVVVLAIVYMSPVVEAVGCWVGNRIRMCAVGEKPVSANIEELSTRLRRSESRSRWRWLYGKLGAALCISVTAWIASVPLVVSCFGRVCLVGWLGSLLASPFVLVLMVLGFIKAGVSLIVGGSCEFLQVCLLFASGALCGVLELIVAVPGVNMRMPLMPGICCVGCYLIPVAAVLWHRRVISAKAATWVGSVAVIGVLVVCCQGVGESQMRITQLAVGRGLSTVIECPGGECWLYDAGGAGSSDPGKYVIGSYLDYRGVDHLDGVIISHANLDHFGGLPYLLSNYKCDVVYVSSMFEAYAYEGSPARVLMDVLRRGEHDVRELSGGEVLVMGDGVKAEVVWPVGAPGERMSVNDSSLVVRLEYRGQKILFTGDIGDAVQRQLVDAGGLGVDVLMLPHHGAVGRVTREFGRLAAPSYMVQSSFASGGDSAARSLVEGEVVLLNTGDYGAVTLLVDETGVTASVFRRTDEFREK